MKWNSKIFVNMVSRQFSPAPGWPQRNAILLRRLAIEPLEQRAMLSIATSAIIKPVAALGVGDKEKARHWYDRATRWMDKNQPRNEELASFRAEAAQVLGVDKKKD